MDPPMSGSSNIPTSPTLSSASYASSSTRPSSDLIQILYASETGNAQDLAERTGREVRRRGGKCRVESMEEFELSQLPHTPLLILLTSTHGRGQPPPAMLPLWNALLRSGLPEDILEDVHFALFALGDSSYEKFCYAGKILARRIEGLGGRVVGRDQRHRRRSRSGMGNAGEERDVGEEADKNEKEEVDNQDQGCLAWGDERAPDGMEEAFLPWLSKTMDAMIPLLSPSPPSPPFPSSGPSIHRSETEGEKEFELLPNSALAPPLFALKSLESAEGSDMRGIELNRSIEDLNLTNRNGDTMEIQATNGLSHTSPANKEKPANGNQSRTYDHIHQELERGWTWARLVKKEKVTPDGWNQDVREVELELEDEGLHDYLPGSICSLKPEISDVEIDTFLRLSGLEEQADQHIVMQPLNPNQPIPPHLPPPNRLTTLRHLLRYNLDLRASPRKSFFEWLRRFSPDENEQERLDEFLVDPDEIYTYATRPRRTILETLADFRATKIPISHILEVLPPLRRRQFSIASNARDHVGKVQLLIALVDYKTNLKIRRRGLLSSWLRDLEIGSRIAIKLDAPTLFLPTRPGTPVILVGPGTGVAPMRAFLEQRMREGEGSNTALYFGCRSKDADLYYQDQWKSVAGNNGVHISIACSRDQQEKIYVQDKIKQDAAMIYDWVYRRNGNVYISGSSNAMPKAVRAAIAWCLSEVSGVGSLKADEAVQYVEQMFESGNRGGEESW